MATVKIGVCGIPRSLKTLEKTLDVVEVQETFYHPKPNKYVEWRRKAPHLEFTVKAWFLITHGYNKMLARKSKLKEDLPFNQREFGGLQLSEANLWALEKVFLSAKNLGSQIILFQTPASLKPNKQLLEEASALFQSVRKEGYIPVWEPRGYSDEERSILNRFSRENQIPLVVDPLRRKPFPPMLGIEYFRLHGLGGREVNYRYKYTEEDLLKLIQLMREYRDDISVYVLFNNIHMYNDALHLKELLGKH
ncbi:MAG: DUF72 domain-containing protein [Desulfurococcales archaeon]|nr:DUF72 domain-containing protein [Desulfurococcales archaeon]